MLFPQQELNERFLIALRIARRVNGGLRRNKNGWRISFFVWALEYS